MWERLEVWIIKILEFCKHSLVDLSYNSLEDNNA